VDHGEVFPDRVPDAAVVGYDGRTARLGATTDGFRRGEAKRAHRHLPLLEHGPAGILPHPRPQRSWIGPSVTGASSGERGMRHGDDWRRDGPPGTS